MTTYESLKNYVASEHLFELGEVIGDASVTVEFARVTPIYRMYNMITSEHLFSSNKSEYDSFQKKLDGKTEFWIGEGIDWLAPSSSSTVVHRLYNAALGAMYRSSHYYTSDKNEINRLIKKYGWVDDGTTKQFYSGGSTPIYTCYNEALGSAHHYTSSKSEWSGLKDHGWDLEESKNVKSNVHTGAFKSVMGANWSYSWFEYYRVVCYLDGQTKPFATKWADTAFPPGCLTGAEHPRFPGYFAYNVTKKKSSQKFESYLEAHYRKGSYRVHFDLNGHGEDIDMQTVNFAEAATPPAEPQSDGYTFDGWYCDPDCTVAYDWNTPMPATDFTLFARWS